MDLYSKTVFTIEKSIKNTIRKQPNIKIKVWWQATHGGRSHIESTQAETETSLKGKMTIITSNSNHKDLNNYGRQIESPHAAHFFACQWSICCVGHTLCMHITRKYLLHMGFAKRFILITEGSIFLQRCISPATKCYNTHTQMVWRK